MLLGCKTLGGDVGWLLRCGAVFDPHRLAIDFVADVVVPKSDTSCALVCAVVLADSNCSGVVAEYRYGWLPKP